MWYTTLVTHITKGVQGPAAGLSACSSNSYQLQLLPEKPHIATANPIDPATHLLTLLHTAAADEPMM